MGDSDKAGLRQMMPSLFNGIATAVAAAAGLIGVLHQTGYLGNSKHPRLRAALEERQREHPRMLDQSGPVAMAVAPAASGAAAGAADNPAAAAAEPPRSHHAKNVSGAWRDMASNCHLVKQAGHELTVTTYVGETGQVRSVGSGTVKGRSLSVRLNSANPASAQVDLILSDDGRELSGMIKGAKGVHAAMWRFIGPSCSELASRPASSN